MFAVNQVLVSANLPLSYKSNILSLHCTDLIKPNIPNLVICTDKQWRFYAGAGGAIAALVFGSAPPLWHDAMIIVTKNNVSMLRCVVLND